MTICVLWSQRLGHVGQRFAVPILLLSSISLPACAASGAQIGDAVSGDVPAVRAVEHLPPPLPVEIVAVPEPMPLPGQLKPLRNTSDHTKAAPPPRRIHHANAAARVEPAQDGFINAMQVYPWSEGALYQVYTAPGQVTDLALQEGEQLVGPGPVAAGDTVRWIIGDTISGEGASMRVHILVKPTRSDLTTNLVINTNYRTYYLELHSGSGAWMASVSWRYPQDELIALRSKNRDIAASAPVASGVDISSLNFGYVIEGDEPAWRPVRAFDDGAKVFIEFPLSIAHGEMPPLFVMGPAGGAELVNYRVTEQHIVVDQLFAAAELRLGGRRQQIVRITKEAASAQKRSRR